MKNKLKIIKTFLNGILPALTGSCFTMDVLYAIKNIHRITTGSGWSVVIYFVLAAAEISLAIGLMYELGKMNVNSKKWKAYNKAQTSYNTSSSSDENETSDEAANT